MIAACRAGPAPPNPVAVSTQGQRLCWLGVGFVLGIDVLKIEGCKGVCSRALSDGAGDMGGNSGETMAAAGTAHQTRDLFASDPIRRRLSAAGLGSFEALWSQRADWIEEPNVARRGWSGVCRLEVNDAAGTRFWAYLKRQENHGYRSLRAPWRVQPTAFREYRRLLALQRAAIQTPQVLYYGERRGPHATRALLMTRAVPRSIPLDAYLALADDRPGREVEHVLKATATLIGRLHRHHIQHCALYGKHVLLSGFQDAPESARPDEQRLVPVLIDLEKARWRPWRIGMALKDLSQFYRRVPWTGTQWETFLADYAGACRLPGMAPFLSWGIKRRCRRKNPPRDRVGGASFLKDPKA